MSDCEALLAEQMTAVEELLEVGGRPASFQRVVK